VIRNAVLGSGDDFDGDACLRVCIGIGDFIQAEIADSVVCAGAPEHGQRAGERFAILLALESAAIAEAEHDDSFARAAAQIGQQHRVAGLATQVATFDQPGDAAAEAAVEFFSAGGQHALVENTDDGALGALAGG
jgi:hypothetical protein